VSQRLVLLDGVHQVSGAVQLDADDQTLLLGRGAFETLRTYNGQLFGLKPHLVRLRQSAAALGLPEHSAELLERELQTAADGISGEAVVRVTLTHGGRRIVRANTLQMPLEAYRCATREWTPSGWLNGSVKHTSRAASVLAVEAAGVDEVIWNDPQGHMLEGTRSNVFAVVGDTFCTPPLDGRLLAGVTRGALLAAARSSGVPVSECALHKMQPFEELYLSSTLKELSPISELDGRPAPGSGPIGRRISAAFYERLSAD
jgi:branched-chain amino acid aminotransferase